MKYFTIRASILIVVFCSNCAKQTFRIIDKPITYRKRIADLQLKGTD
ncbi:hypothetical protein SAMN05661044_00402 [Olivibacter domesticus]|uniref:Uncharacterized protein n=1 Tax=Olivibacter domesticus TaxID=407022 RepID=A0A1H7HJG2_OLID1|nr:hypothetical protein SAMN05661044_00402 [Olivibacter domesticus]